MNKAMISVFLVDDDVVFLKSLEIEFRESGEFSIQTFISGELCIEALAKQPDLIILDYLLDGVDETAINGIETLDQILQFNPAIPVVMLSAQDKIEVAVDCMHHQAYDYVVKSETAFFRLQKIITRIFKERKTDKILKWYMERV